LYVQYKKKRDEYRVHMFRGGVIDVTQKRAVNQEDRTETFNRQIRNHGNGWVFCREDVDPPDAVWGQAYSAVRALGLEFGAVDVIWNDHYQTAYVLEVNTAPGLEGTTLERYVEAIRSIMQ
jgi:glutathione synthase/RimK-type ligase-like ATP-grasp enzyme